MWGCWGWQAARTWVSVSPEFSCLPVAGSPYRTASTVHETWGRERNFLSRRIGCLPARPLASALRRLERLIHSPLYRKPSRRVGCLPARPLASALCQLASLYRKLSSAPDTFLLLSRASDLHWTFLSWAPVLLFILPLCPVSVLFSRSRDPGRAPKCYARCLNPWAGREKASKTMQLAKKGKFITDSSQGFCRNQHNGAGSEKAPSPSCYINL